MQYAEDIDAVERLSVECVRLWLVCETIFFLSPLHNFRYRVGSLKDPNSRSVASLTGLYANAKFTCSTRFYCCCSVSFAMLATVKPVLIEIVYTPTASIRTNSINRFSFSPVHSFFSLAIEDPNKISR